MSIPAHSECSVSELGSEDAENKGDPIFWLVLEDFSLSAGLSNYSLCPFQKHPG